MVELHDLDEDFVDVRCGSQHTLALTSKGQVWGWGWNMKGQVVQQQQTQGQTASKATSFSTPQLISFNANSVSSVHTIGCGWWHSIVCLLSSPK